MIINKKETIKRIATKRKVLLGYVNAFKLVEIER